MPRALVTGATGLVGSHIAERLRSDGWDVRALVRAPDSGRWLEKGGVELVGGDVTDASIFAAAAAGCDTIFHAAAVITGRGDWESYRRLNVDGTANAVAAAERSGARLVQVSSVAVYGSETRYRVDGSRTDESTPLPPPASMAVYGRSKRESEELVLGAHGAGRIWATALRPSVVYGPRDRQFTPRVGRLLSHGVMPLIGGGRSTLAIVHAANVADGAIRAANTGHAGGRAYNLTNDGDVTVKEFVQFATEGLGRRIRTPVVPYSIARAGVAALSSAVALVKGRALATQARSTLAFLTHDNPFSSERARRELGWAPPVRPDDGIRDAFRWWRENSRAG